MWLILGDIGRQCPSHHLSIPKSTFYSSLYMSSVEHCSLTLFMMVFVFSVKHFGDLVKSGFYKPRLFLKFPLTHGSLSFFFLKPRTHAVAATWLVWQMGFRCKCTSFCRCGWQVVCSRATIVFLEFDFFFWGRFSLCVQSSDLSGFILGSQWHASFDTLSKGLWIIQFGFPLVTKGRKLINFFIDMNLNLSSFWTIEIKDDLVKHFKTGTLYFSHSFFTTLTILFEVVNKETEFKLKLNNHSP